MRCIYNTIIRVIIERQYAYDSSEKEKIIPIGQKERKAPWRRQRGAAAQGIAADWEWVHHIQGKGKIQLGRNYIRKSQGIIKASRPGESEWDCLLQVMGGKI